MNLLCISTNKGIPIDGGFRHSVFTTSKVNGEMSINIISSEKFSTVINEQHWIDAYRTNPKKFLKEINDDEDSQSDDNPDDSGSDLA